MTLEPMALDLVEVIAANEDGKLVEIVIIPAGHVDMRRAGGNGPDFPLMDEEAFERIEAQFKRIGRDLLIDFEHQVLGEAKSKRADGRVPAAGWIKSLRFDPDVGLIASVKWTAEARDLIKTDQYRYLSPVAFIDKKDRRIVELHSAAVTNDPAIPGMRPLAAKRVSLMAKKDKKPRDGVRAVLGKDLADRAVCQDDVDTAEIIEEVVEEIDPVGEKLAALKAVLMEAGKVDETASPVDILDAAITALSAAPEEEGAEAEAVEAVRKSLGLDSKADTKLIVATVDKLRGERVPVEQLATLKTELDELKAVEAARRSAVVVAKYVDEGRLNPNDKEQLAWAEAKAKDDLEGFEDYAKRLPVLYDTKTHVTRQADDGSTASDGRGRVIARAKKEYTKDAAGGATLRGWVDGALDDAGEKNMTETEAEALVK